MLVEVEEGKSDQSSNQTGRHSNRQDDEEHILFGDRAELEVTYDVFDHVYSIRSLKGHDNLIRPLGGSNQPSGPSGQESPPRSP